MSEENKWGTGLPDEDKNASAEQKPLTHPYSEGRRMQESRQDSDAGAGQSEGTSQEKPKYGHYEVHQPQAGNYAGGNIPPKKPRKKRDFSGNNSFGKKAATAVALAVIFGLVAGVVFQGVNIAADKYRGNDSNTTIGKTETVTGTEDSTDSSSADSTVKDIVAESGTVAGVAQATMSSIVAITSVSVQEIPSFFGYGTRQYQSAGSGSGIIVGENDSELLIATNNHVVSGATTLTVCFAGSDVVGAEEETQAMASSSDGDADVDNAVSAKIKGTDEENDLAVVAVEKSDIPDETMDEIKIAQMGSSDDLVVGEQDVRRVLEQFLMTGHDVGGGHGMIVLVAAALAHLAHIHARGHIVAQFRTVVDEFGQSFRLVGGEGVHRVDEDGLDALASKSTLPVAVVEDRVQETFGLA